MAADTSLLPSALEQILAQQTHVPIPERKKRKRPVIFAVIFFCLFIGAGVTFFLTYMPMLTYSEEKLTSPLVEDDITSLLKRPPTQSYAWKPQVVAAENIAKLPTLTAKSAMAMNFKSDKVYFAKDVKRKLPMASITKVMVALLVLEHKQIDDKVTISERAASVGENSMALSAGETYTVQDLLYGLFLHSGNDAAEALGESVAGTREQFVKLMNQRAWELGMLNTHYTNPSGLEGDGNMYTTVEDLAILTKFILTKYPFLLDITRTINYTIAATPEHKAIYLSSEIDLIRTYPGAIGFKTGLTDEAGRCIITIAENAGEQMMVIVLGSENRKIDAVKMLDYAFGLEGIHVAHQPFW